jgi:hypothetical protein
MAKSLSCSLLALAFLVVPALAGRALSTVPTLASSAMKDAASSSTVSLGADSGLRKCDKVSAILTAGNSVS